MNFTDSHAVLHDAQMDSHVLFYETQADINFFPVLQEITASVEKKKKLLGVLFYTTDATSTGLDPSSPLFTVYNKKLCL